MKIKVFNEKCTGCGLCENICSLSHLGFVDRNCSAIKVKLDDLGESIHHPFLCRQCKNMKCLDGEDIIGDKIAGERQKFIWEQMDRVEKCPFNGCFGYNGKVYHCNLCEGEPQCVKVCTHGALQISE